VSASLAAAETRKSRTTQSRGRLCQEPGAAEAARHSPQCCGVILWTIYNAQADPWQTFADKC
jgi:hypothetical protein